MIDTRAYLQYADPRTRAWWAAVLREDLDEAFSLNLLTLRDDLLRRRSGAVARARTRLEGLRKAAKALPAGGLARTRLERKAELVAALEGELDKGGMFSDDSGPTPETAVRRRNGDPIRSLYESGVLDDAEAQAAMRLRKVFESVAAPVMTRTSRWDGVPGAGHPSGSGQRTELLGAELAAEHAATYLPWTRTVAGWTRRGRYRPLDLILDVVVMELAIEPARRKHGCRASTAKADVKEALALYAKMVGLGRYGRLRKKGVDLVGCRV